MMKKYTLLLLLCVFLGTLTPLTAARGPLPSWNDGPIKKRIINFVDEVTDPSSTSFVKPEERIAVFDNDGTLWCEKPLYIHVFAILDRYKELTEANPLLDQLQPYKAIANKDIRYFTNLYENFAFDTLLGQLIAIPFGGMTTSAYEAWCRQWLATWQHPNKKVSYKELVYQPMVELIDYLQTNLFKVYIFTADEADFLRLVSKELYGIPPEMVHGSSVRLEYITENGRPELRRTYRANFLNNWDRKPCFIYQTLGRKPIIAVGNSNGDLHMLQYTAEQDQSTLSLLVHHTDAAREYQYDSDTEKVLPLARKEGWEVIDMKEDWKVIFP